MNTLSLFLYFADVLPNIFEPIISVLFTTLIAYIAYRVICAMTNILTQDEYRGSEEANAEKRKNAYEHMKAIFNKIGITIASLLFLSYIINAAIPSRETFYMIAGSEIGEMVVQSDEAKEIMVEIKEVIKTQLKSMKATDIPVPSPEKK